MANGVIEIVPNIPFMVVVSNLKESPLKLSKASVVALLLFTPTELAQLPRKEYRTIQDSMTTFKTNATSMVP